jgi:predicted secreted protein/putative hemolysin
MDRIVYFIIAAVVVVAVGALAVLSAPDGQPEAGLANPAAVYCTEMGYGYEIRSDASGNQYGVCILPDGTERDAWEVYYEAHPRDVAPLDSRTGTDGMITLGAEAHPRDVAPLDTQVGTDGMITLGAAESGGSFSIESGRAFAISLDENPTTGYGWVLALPEGIIEDSEGFEPPAEGLVGAGGVRTWTMHGEAPGSYEITAEYIRPWETGAEPAANFSVSIEIV